MSYTVVILIRLLHTGLLLLLMRRIHTFIHRCIFIYMQGNMRDDDDDDDIGSIVYNSASPLSHPSRLCSK